jgi:hypothetical protein
MKELAAPRNADRATPVMRRAEASARSPAPEILKIRRAAPREPANAKTPNQISESPRMKAREAPATAPELTPMM